MLWSTPLTAASQGSVSVQLTDLGDQVTLEILDDGIGLACR